MSFSTFGILAVALTIGIALFWIVIGLQNNKKKRGEKRLKKVKKMQLQRIHQLYEKKAYAEVAKLIDPTKTSDIKLLQMLAHSQFEIGNHEEAFKRFRHALARAGSEYDKYDIRKNAAICYYQLEDYKNTIKMLQEIGGDPLKDKMSIYSDYNVPLLLGHSFYQIGQYKTAIQAYRKAPVNKKIPEGRLIEVWYRMAEAYE